MNARGQYGRNRNRAQAHATLVGVFDTPSEIATGLDQLDSEFSKFFQEVEEATDSASSREKRRIMQDPKYKGLDATEKMFKDLVSRSPANSQVRANWDRAWSDALRALNVYLDRRMRASQEPLLLWKYNTWLPLWGEWFDFHDDKEILRTLPGANVWNQVQEFRKKLVDVRRNAPFRAKGPEPLPPSPPPPPSPSPPPPPPPTPTPPASRPPPPGSRADPKSPGADGAVGSFVKYALIGGLVIGGAFLTTKLVKARS